MKKRILLVIMCVLLLTSGCFKRDKMEDVNIITTTYPIQYLIENIYGYNSTIKSIYPNGIELDTYTKKITNKQIREFSKSDIFIYNGLSEEKPLAAKMLNNNKKLKVIDVTKGISLQRKQEELWLSPSNYLMLAQNIKKGLNEYISSTIIKKEIEDNYEDLKLTISKYDAELKVIADNASNKTIIAGNDVFKFLEKYGFTVLSVEDNELLVSKEFQKAKDSLEKKELHYIFVLDTDEETENVKKFQNLGATVVKVNSIDILSEDESNTGYDYKQMMESFIEAIKTEVYN